MKFITKYYYKLSLWGHTDTFSIKKLALAIFIFVNLETCYEQNTKQKKIIDNII